MIKNNLIDIIVTTPVCETVVHVVWNFYYFDGVLYLLDTGENSSIISREIIIVIH